MSGTHTHACSCCDLFFLQVDISELLDASYANLFNKEVTRRLKAVPTAFYQKPPTRLFDANCATDFGGWAIAADD